MHTLVVVAIALSVPYGILMVLYRIGFGMQARTVLPDGYVPTTFLTVVVPARNEEAHLAACLESLSRQKYPAQLFEVVVADDHSGDRTADIVQQYAGTRIKYVSPTEVAATGIAHKKAALTAAIAKARGSVIVTVDADCIAGRDLLACHAYSHEVGNADMVVGPVQYDGADNPLGIFQALDFMAMQGITAATHRLGLGNMCNGANLSFSKRVFDELGGYAGTTHLATGDDYLLMTKFAARPNTRIAYLKTQEAIVSTPPQPDWRSFLAQRTRWASKSGKYKDPLLTTVLVFVYLYNACLAALMVLAIGWPQLRFPLLGLLMCKTLVELLLMVPVARYFKASRYLLFFPAFQPLHIAYVVVAGFLGMRGSYNWKGRTVK